MIERDGVSSATYNIMSSEKVTVQSLLVVYNMTENAELFIVLIGWWVIPYPISDHLFLYNIYSLMYMVQIANTYAALNTSHSVTQ